MEIRPKMFDEVEGRIEHSSIRLERVGDGEYCFSFDFVNKDGKRETFLTNSKRVILKFGYLYGFSVAQLKEEIEDKKATIESVNKFIRDTVSEKPKTTKLLLHGGELVNIVSDRHKQVSMVEVIKRVDMIAREFRFKKEKVVDLPDSYNLIYSVGKARLMGMFVHVKLGKNDGYGHASLRFQAAGNIFACTNEIIPFVHKSVQFSFEHLARSKRVFHTKMFEEHASNEIRANFVASVSAAKELDQKLLESKKVVMPRVEQVKLLNLVAHKFGLGEKWRKRLLERIEKEKETLYGASQAITFVATHIDGGSGVRERMKRIGGTVVLLGKEVMPLIKKM